MVCPHDVKSPFEGSDVVFRAGGAGGFVESLKVLTKIDVLYVGAGYNVLS